METIKASQYRIGNLVYRITQGEAQRTLETPFYVTGIERSHLTLSEGIPFDHKNPHPSFREHITHIAGIQATKEWMLKFGLKNDIGSTAYRLNQFCIIIWPTGLITVEFKNVELCQVKCIHEIQNLYYSLTKQELVFT